MWERTITIGSAGKTFSVTGWKTGWAYGPANLMVNLQMVHQNCVYTCTTPIQVGTGDFFLSFKILIELKHRIIILFLFPMFEGSTFFFSGSHCSRFRKRTRPLWSGRLLLLLPSTGTGSQTRIHGPIPKKHRHEAHHPRGGLFHDRRLVTFRLAINFFSQYFFLTVNTFRVES